MIHTTFGVYSPYLHMGRASLTDLGATVLELATETGGAFCSIVHSPFTEYLKDDGVSGRLPLVFTSSS